MDGELHYWIAWCKGEVVGYCATKVFDEYIFLARSAVKPAFRGMGIHGRMIRARELFHGQNTYITYASRFNPASMNSLIKHKYKMYVPESRYGGVNAVYFYKEEI